MLYAQGLANPSLRAHDCIVDLMRTKAYEARKEILEESFKL